MTINDVKKLFDFVCNNYEKGGNVNGDEFTLLFNVAQGNHYAKLIGFPEQYQPGRPIPRIGLGGNETLSSRLAPFLKTGRGANLNKPEDFNRLVAMRTTSDAQIDRVEHDRIAARLKSEVVPVATNPFYAEFADRWEVWPKTITAINYEYYPVKPPDVKWAYTETGGREVYDQVSSINPAWKDADILGIVASMLQMSGVAVDDMLVLQLSNKIMNTGE